MAISVVRQWVSGISILLISFSSFAAGSSRAICDQLLSSTALTAPEASSSDLDLTQFNPAARSYIALLELYIKQNGGQLPQDIQDKILNSSSFVNPFSNRTDSVSAQLRAAFDRLQKLSKGSNAQTVWIQAQSGVKNLIQENDNAALIHQKSKEETKAILNPSILDKKNIGGPISATPAWIIINNRLLLAVEIAYKRGHFQIYEFSTETNQLILTDEVQLERERGEDSQNSSLAWQVISNRVFLTATNMSHVYLYELNQSSFKLEPIKKHFVGRHIKMPSWQIINNRLLLTVYADRIFYLYEFDQNLNNFVELDAIDLKSESTASSGWQFINGKIFMAISPVTKPFSLYEIDLETNKFILRQSFNLDSPIYNAPLWQTVGDRVFLSAGAMDHHILILEFDKKSEQLIDFAKKQINDTVFVPSWHIHNEKIFIIGGAFSGTIYLYELDLATKQITELDSKKLSERVNSTPVWYNFGNRIFTSVTSWDKNLYFYEIDLNTKTLVQRAEINTNGFVSSDAPWIEHDKRVFVTIGSDDHNLYMIEALK